MSRKAVAIVGASADRAKFSNKAIRAYIDQGWDVYPVNPKGGSIEGLVAYPTLGDVPAPIDRVSLYLPPAVGARILPQIARANPSEFFVNPGAESDELVAEAQELGLTPILACSIIDIGSAPAQYADS